MAYITACTDRQASLLRAVKTRSPFTANSRLRQRSCSATCCSRWTLQVLPHQLQHCAERARCLVSTQAHSADSPAPQGSNSVLKQSLSAPAQPNNNAPTTKKKPVAEKLGTLWGLLILAIAYVHHSTTGYVRATCQQHVL